MALSKKRFVDVVSSLEYDELVELQRDLFNGARGTRQVISNKLKEITEKESRICGTCGESINLRVASEFTLILGTSTTKKRASFCALDCLEYFATNLKRLSSKSVQKPGFQKSNFQKSN